MSLYEDLIKAEPLLTADDFHPMRGKIKLQDDGDGEGAYIAQWDHELPIPQDFKLGK